MKPSSLFQPGAASPPYEAVRDAGHLSDVKAFIEQIWAEFRPPGDLNFLEDAKVHFHERTWELYVWYVLKSHGLNPQKTGRVGPDFFFTHKDKTVWVEAIAPGIGYGPDAVPRLRFLNDMLEAGEEPIAQDVPEEAILLRFTQAITDKLRKFEDYRTKGIVGTEDSFVIAINGCLATDYRGDGDLPYIIKATIAVGHLQILIDPAGELSAEGSYQRREVINKKSGTKVRTDLFLTDEFKPVSGVLYSPKDICNIPQKVGCEMTYFHNPLACNALTRGCFVFCTEYWADLENGKLHHRDWHLE
jgi:hypothetical protein